jgi:E3 ubiquitin-protein ligase TRIP12
LIYEKFFRSGTKEAFDSFRYGFNSVFPVKNLKAFLSSELEEILCSSTNENWDYETLYENINPNHGYYKNR